MTRQEMSDPFWLGNNIRLQVWPLITITYSILMAYILRSGVTYAAHVRQTLGQDKPQIAALIVTVLFFGSFYLGFVL